MKRLNGILVICLVLGFSLSLAGSGLLGCKKQVEEVAEVTPEAPELTPDEPIPPDEPPFPPPPPPPPPDELIELKLINKINFKSKINKAIFNKRTGNPTIIIEDNNIDFLDENGKIRLERKIESQTFIKPVTVTSRSNNLIGIWKPIKVSEKRDVEEFVFTLLNKNGEVLFETKSVYPVFISDSGKYFVSISDPLGVPDIYFYGNQKLMNRVTLSGGQMFPSITDGFYSIDEKYFIISFIDLSNLNKPQPILACYKNNGVKFWRKKIGGGPIAISEDDKYLAVTGTSERDSKKQVVSLLRLDGNLIWEKELTSRCFSISFSPDGYYLGVVGERVALFDVLTGEKIWEYQPANSTIQFESCKVSNNGKFLLIGAISYNPPKSDGRITVLPSPNDSRFVHLFNGKGEVIWKKILSGKEYEEWSEGPVINLSDDGKRAIVASGKEVYIYEIPSSTD